MSKSRKLGKGLEDISHLFLSSEKEKGTSTENTPAGVNKIPPEHGLTTKYLCLVGDEPDFRHAFLVFHLSLALAKYGLRTAIVDMDEELPCMQSVMSNKAGSDRSINADTFIKEGPSGIQFVGFSETVIARVSGTEMDDHVVFSLKKIEKENDLILLSVSQETLLRMDTVLPDSLKEFVILVSPKNMKMLNAYKIIKAISSLNPLANIGIIITTVDHLFQSDLVYDKMSGAVEKYLDRELCKYGFLYKIETRAGDGLINDLSHDKALNDCISSISQSILFSLTSKESLPPPELILEIIDHNARLRRSGEK